MPGQRFRRRRFGPGYRVEDVDKFLDALESGRASAAEIERVQFRSVPVGGYDEREVDLALDNLAKAAGPVPDRGTGVASSAPWWRRLIQGGRE